jgi:uncharacterized protein (TIGR02271 family)
LRETVQILRSLIRIFVISLCLGIFVAQPAGAAQRQADGSSDAAPDAAPPVFVGGQKIAASAIVDRGRLLVPVRGVFEGIGADVQFSPPKFVVVRKDGAVIAAFILDRARAVVGHESVVLDVAPMQRDGRVYVPLRVVAEAAGATVAYSNRPPSVHIRADAAPAGSGSGPAGDLQTLQARTASTAQWRLGVAVFSGLCCLGCLVLTARRFAPTVLRAAPLWPAAPPAPPAPRRRPPSPLMPQALHVPRSERMALASVEATGEARLRKQVVTETRTIEVPVTREELVIEYAGEGGTVIVDGHRLEAGETIRIPLWEERVQVDVSKHVLRKEDIVVGKRRSTFAASNGDHGQPLDFGVAEGSPS